MVWRNLSCHFLKVWGCDAYVRKFQSDKLEPKGDKCIFIGYPKQLDISPISDPEAKCLRVLSREKVSLEIIEWEGGGT